MANKQQSVHWKVHTKGLLREVINQLEKKQYTALHIPLKQFVDLLLMVAERAAELNDPELDALMCRLQLYLQSDPENKEFDQDFTHKTITKGMRERAKRKAG